MFVLAFFAACHCIEYRVWSTAELSVCVEPGDWSTSAYWRTNQCWYEWNLEKFKNGNLLIMSSLKKKNSYKKITNFGRPFASICPLIETFSFCLRGNARKAYFSMMVTNFVSSFEKHLTFVFNSFRKKEKNERRNLWPFSYLWRINTHCPSASFHGLW